MSRTEYMHPTYKKLWHVSVCHCSRLDWVRRAVLKYSECFNYRFSGLILPCLAVVGCWWCTSQWRFWYITIAESAFHEYHPPVQLLASLENFFWKGHGFDGFKMIILQASSFPLHMWPHGSSLKAEAPLGRLWSRAQTVAHSAAVASCPALPRCCPDWSLSAVEYKVTTITTQLAQKWWE